MSSDFATLCASVWADPQVQRSLDAITDTDPFVQAVISVALDRGLRITGDEVRSELMSARRSWIERSLP